MIFSFTKYVKQKKVLLPSSIFITIIVLFFIKSFYYSYVDPDNVLNTPITRKNFNNVVDIVFDKKIDLNDGEANFLEELHTINLGRKKHLEYLSRKGYSYNTKLLANKYRFNRVRNLLFDFIEENNVTLNDFFNYLNEKDVLRSKFDNKHSKFYKKVDSYNLEVQSYIDNIPSIIEKEIDKLNDRFSIEYDGIEVVDHVPIDPNVNVFLPVLELKIKGINHSLESIKHLRYTIVFLNENGEKLYSLDRGSPTNTYVGYEYNSVISFEPRIQPEPEIDEKKMTEDQLFLLRWRENKNRIYNSLTQGLIHDVKIKVTKLSTAENTYPDLGELKKYAKYENHNYKTPERLNGYGPYSNEEMIQRKEELDKEWRELVSDSLGLLSTYDVYIFNLYNYNEFDADDYQC